MSIAPRCEECGSAFSLLRGGICERCGRMLCGRHLHGFVAQLWAPFGREPPVCARCREGAATGRAGGGG